LFDIVFFFRRKKDIHKITVRKCYMEDVILALTAQDVADTLKTSLGALEES